MKKDNQQAETLAKLICELTRNCNIKEDYFASSFNLSPTEVKLLKLFVFKQSISIKELCSDLKLSSGRITHIVSSLEKKKLLKRDPDPADKRNIIVSILPGCFPFIKNINDNYIALHQQILKEAGAENREKIISALEVLNSIFVKWVEEK